MTKEKSEIRSRGWLLTIFEQPEGLDKPRTEDDVASLLDPLPWCGQLEEGHKTHHRHWQIYLEVPNAIRFSSLHRRCPDMHIEPRKGSKKQAFDYCTKGDTRVEGPFFHGITEEDCGEDESGVRTDLAELADLIRNGQTVDKMLLDEDLAPRLARCMNWARGIERAVFEERYAKYKTEDRKVVVRYVWGEPGIGKTHSIKTLDAPVFEPSADGKWDGYSGQDIVLFDEFDGSLPLGSMNRWLEGYRDTRLPARYHDSFACYHTVYIVSNYPPESFYNGAKSWLRRLTTVEHATRESLRLVDGLEDMGITEQDLIDLFGEAS